MGSTCVQTCMVGNFWLISIQQTWGRHFIMIRGPSGHDHDSKNSLILSLGRRSYHLKTQWNLIIIYRQKLCLTIPKSWKSKIYSKWKNLVGNPEEPPNKLLAILNMASKSIKETWYRNLIIVNGKTWTEFHFLISEKNQVLLWLVNTKTEISRNTFHIVQVH